MERQLGVLAVLVIAFLLAGCASTSSVHFQEPTGAQMELMGERHTFPVFLELPQKGNPDTDDDGRVGLPLRITLRDGTRIRGYLHVYRLQMDQIEELAEVSFRLTSEQIEKLKSGHAVTVSGYSARERLVYRINLGIER